MSLSLTRTTARERAPELIVELATTAADVHASQVLRYQIFAQEMGARLASAEELIDRDHHDPFCHHLLVRRKDSGKVVGSTRILTQANARLAGSFYSENEFDLSQLLPLNGEAIEIGRTCIHPAYRNGITIHTLWMGLAAFMDQHKVDYLFGCASIGLQDGSEAAEQMITQIRDKHEAPARFQVTPHQRFCGERGEVSGEQPKLKLPPLLNAYLRLGAWVVGEAYLDEDFNCADLFILLDVRNLSGRYRRHFVDAPQERRGEQGGYPQPPLRVATY